MKSNIDAVYLLIVCVIAGFAHAAVSDFENLTLAPESAWNGSDGSGGFSSGNAYFGNVFTDWGGGFTSWDGFAYSNITDTSASGFGSQYNAISGSGANSSANYAIGFAGWTPSTITLNTLHLVDGFNVTNNNYAYYSMLNGDDFAKQFGATVEIDSETGNEVVVNMDAEDWLMLTITGKDAAGQITADPVEFYLADFRSTDNSQDYIVDSWEYVDITSLGFVKTLEFTLSSSDAGVNGMNTPAYFVIDNVVPEPATLSLLVLGTLLLRRKKN